MAATVPAHQPVEENREMMGKGMAKSSVSHWNSCTHTLAQKNLIELLMWNASYVRKHFSKT
jgi:hypothetical protein